VRAAPFGSVDALLDVMAGSVRHADEEDVDLLAHALQCAQRLRAVAPDDIELQIAGLVHDVGTALVPDAPDRHARIGADAVRALLGARVARLVAGHAEAKRYLVAVDASYRAALSERSIVTLAAQGGPLEPKAASAFARGRDAEALVALRHADDAAKVPGAVVAELETWRPVITSMIADGDPGRRS
jgi:predicted HD phosphohydrolase